MNEMVHTIFVIKYWILSKKVHSYWDQTKDNSFYFKKLMLSICLPLLIITMTIVYCYNYIFYFPFSKFGYAVYLTFYSLPPFMILCIIGVAFLNLRGKSNEFY